MNAVIYARFSSHNQREESIEGQVRECRAFAERNNIRIIKVYADRAVSGKTDNRPEFQRMIADSAKGQFEAVIVYQLDRFARNRYDSAIYKAKLKKNGVKVLSAKEHITNEPAGIILESILEGMAEYYSAELSQKIKRGMRENALKCKVTGGNIALGYKIGPNKEFEIDPLTAPIVREIFSMYAAGMTVTQIINNLNARGLKTSRGVPFNKNSLHRLLKNEKYIGVYKWNDVVIEGGVPAIVDKELFYEVQEILKKNKAAPARARSQVEYLLTTKIFCGMCGSNMVGESGTGRSRTYYYYKCVKQKREKACSKKPVSKDWIEDLVINETIRRVLVDEVIEMIADRVVELQERENDNSALKALEERLKEVKKSIANIIHAIEQGAFYESTQKRLQELEEERQDLEVRIAQESIVKPKVTKEQVIFWLNEFRKGDINDPEFRKRIIEVFVRAVYVYDDKIIVTYNYLEDDGQPKASTVEGDESGIFNDHGSALTSVTPPTKSYPNLFVLPDCFGIIIEIADKE